MINLITDRNSSDLQALMYLKEKALTNGWSSLSVPEKEQWNSSMKASYNASDLNRVGNAINDISDLLNLYGYSVSVTAKTDWSENQSPPTVEQMNDYLKHISDMRAVYAVKSSTPVVPISMNKLTLSKANDIEQILKDIYQLIGNMILTFWSSGELMAGENI